jgi:hypothetical protein
MHKGIEVPYPELRQLVTAAGVTNGMRQADAQRRLMPHAKDILAYVYGHIADGAIAQGIQPIWIFLPQLSKGAWQEETEETVAIAAQAGFILIRLDEVFADEDIDTLRLAEWDEHPTTYGHRLIADDLLDGLRGNRARIFSSGAFAAGTGALAP